MKKDQDENLRRKRKYLTELGGGLDEALGQDGRKKIVRNVKGRRGNAPIYRAQKWGQQSDASHSEEDTWRSL